jgi:CheY-like chemotaxis protein
MDAAQKLLQAIATVLWPSIVVLVIVLFRPAAKAIMESAKSRKFTLKIGGQELTMEEANSVQQKLIADLQAQVSALQKSMGGAPPTEPLKMPESNAAPISRGNLLLWVDDNPKNNAYFIQQLNEVGITVDTATSTAEGCSRFNSRKYDYVITDMGRKEDRKGDPPFNPHAGIDLIKSVREKDKRVPIIVFSSVRALSEYGSQALQAGANAVTSSTTELFGLLNVQAMKAHA